MPQNVRNIQINDAQIDTNGDDWSLTTDQMIFMLEHHNAIETADDEDDDTFFEQLINSIEFRALFGDMTFDEAFDRYETMLEAGRGDT
jgi:hypothetical protein